MSPIFTYPLLIKEQHLDSFAHVNNATYLTLFEEARWDFVTKNGYGMERMLETGIGPVILEIKLRFLREIRLRENVIIQSQIISYNGKIGVIKQQMMRDSEVCCEAEFTIGLFDLNERKMIAPTAEWMRAIGIN